MEFSHIDSRYKYLFFISQAETERVIREQLARQGVEIERPVEMIALAQEASAHLGRGGVTATLRHKDGTLEEVEACYLISAEDAHNTVRSTVGLDYHGKTLEESYALGDLRL